MRQLRLYDFLADLIPGALALLLAALGYYELTGGSPPFGSLNLGSGVVLVVLAYLVGRTVHLFAGQKSVERLREYLDFVVFGFNRVLVRLGWDRIRSEPRVRQYLDGSSGESSDSSSVYDQCSLNESVEASLRSRIRGEFDIGNGEPNSEIPEPELKAFTRFAYSEVFPESSLYQRYNIQETYYRNLWATTTLAAAWALGIAGALEFEWSVMPDKSPMTFVIASVGFLLAGFAFQIRRIQFKHRQVRALINELYLRYDREETTRHRVDHLLGDVEEIELENGEGQTLRVRQNSGND